MPPMSLPWLASMLAVTVVAVLVVLVSDVSWGGLEQTKGGLPDAWHSACPLSGTCTSEGCSMVGEARIVMGNSWIDDVSTPVGAVINVTRVGSDGAWGDRKESE
eukprot:g26357.t1